MFFQNKNDDPTKDRKLAAVAYLRERADADKHRLLQVKHILDGEECASCNSMPPKDTSEAEAPAFLSSKKHSSSLRNRCIFCLILFALFFFGKENSNSRIFPYMQEIKSVISADYSDNLFDFLRQIPYTLDYEKINVK